jgi:chromosome segregation ATPase
MIALTLGAAVPRDVSTSLDVYEQVKMAVESNIMKVDSIGYFNGTNSVNRFDLADTVYRLVNYIMSTKAIIEASGLSNKVSDLESKNESIRTELALLRSRLDVLEVSFSKTELDAMERRLNGLKDEVISEMQSLEQRTKFISGYNDFLSAVEQELRTLYTRVEEHNSRLTATEANTGRLLTYLKKYETLDTWLPTVEASFTSQERKNALSDRSMQEMQKKIDALLILQEQFSSLQKEVTVLKVTTETVSVIPQITNIQSDQERRLKNLEAANATLVQVQQELDYLKIENDELKHQNEDVKKQLWYAFGVGIGGAMIGIAAFAYAYMLWGGSVAE